MIYDLFGICIGYIDVLEIIFILFVAVLCKFILGSIKISFCVKVENS